MPKLQSRGSKAMKLSTYGVCILLIVIFLSSCFLSSCARGANEGNKGVDTLETIIRDWEHRRRSIRSIEYQLEGEGIVPKGRWTGDHDLPASVKGSVPEQDYSYGISMTIILDFENGFAKTDEQKEMFYFSLAKFVPSQWIKVYDGERFVALTPRETNTGAGYTPGAKQPSLWEALKIESFFTEQASPVFLLAGRFREGGWDVRKLDATTSLKSLTFAGKGKLVGRDCAILRLNSARHPANAQEYWFDTAPGSALLRWVQYNDGNVVLDVHFSYAPEGSEGWPRSWEIAWYPSPHKLELQNRMKVKLLQLNKQYQRRLFQIERTPGMVVAAGKEGFVRVNEDGSSTKLLLAEGDPSPSKSGWRWAYLWVILGLFVICLIVVVGRKSVWAKWQTKSDSP